MKSRNFFVFTMLTKFLFAAHAQDVTKYVNLFIGTTGGGNTFPGAVRPWGMVSVSPHTNPASPSGYTFGHKDFFGFGHNHLSGTGCAELGSIIITAIRDSVRITPDEYKCTSTDERAEPGYYAVTLKEPSVRLEATVTERSGLIRLTPFKKGRVTLILDVGRSLALVGGGGVTVVSNNEVEGYNISGGFCGESNRETVYFAARMNKASSARGVWIDNAISSELKAQTRDTSVGAYLTFVLDQSEALLIKVGLSYVGTHNARLNLDTEIPAWHFEDLRNRARLSWEEQLSKITVEDSSTEEKTKFYTSLYHTLLHPSILSDVNGEYPLMGRNGIGRYAGRERYSVFSLWDTYRTLHPFLSLVYPERQSSIIQTMIDIYRESGWLPKWELISNETYMMVGDPAVITLADTYVKGIRDFDVSAGFEAMRKPAVTLSKEALPARPGYSDFLQYGFIPADQDTTQQWWVWGPVSTTLEYCLADWSLAQIARALGKFEEATEFERRSLFYRNLFDPDTKFLRPRFSNGTWLHPFDPLLSEGSGSWQGSGGPGYVEGNAWTYTWFVPHDIEGLIELFGGVEPFATKLDQCFENRHFTATNEPDLAYPYLYTYLPGKEYRAQELVREIMKQEFGTDAGGLPGNDDCGTISAWFVFSALGFYPACPASDFYQLGFPYFSRLRIRLNNKYYPGRELLIERRESSANDISVGDITFNGKKIQKHQLRHSDIVKGGALIFHGK